MAHFAKIENNIVTQVLVVDNKDLLDNNGIEQESIGITFCKSLFGEDTNWVQTSYNKSFRGIYAGINYLYNEEEDIFVTPQPFLSWTRNGSFWEAPTPMPTDGQMYRWVEDDLNWQVIPTE